MISCSVPHAQPSEPPRLPEVRATLSSINDDLRSQHGRLRKAKMELAGKILHS